MLKFGPVIARRLRRRRPRPTDVAIAQREAQVDPDRMLDDRWRKAVAGVGDSSHRASLPSASLAGYPVTLTKPAGNIMFFEETRRPAPTSRCGRDR